MSPGRIIYTPALPTGCERGVCEDLPRAPGLRDGTIWECGLCAQQWRLTSEMERNEEIRFWKKHTPVFRDSVASGPFPNPHRQPDGIGLLGGAPR